MIGLPVQSIDGIEVTCLLNPQIVPGKVIQINQASIQEAKLSPDYLAAVNNTMIPWTADDGYYKVLLASHLGDTRGDPWYTQIICTRADGLGPQPIGIASKGINVDPEQK